jgi:RNA polymerase sigma-70 factor (ECF subfamily)
MTTEALSGVLAFPFDADATGRRAADDVACDPRQRLRARIPRIRRLVVRLLGRGDDIDDVVQEVLVQCLRSLPTVRSPATFDEWVTSVTTHVVHGALRGRTRFRRRIECVAEPPDVPAPDGALAGADAVLVRRCLERVQDILEALDPELRAAFVLRVMEEVKLEQVAEWLGVSLATAKRRIAAAEAAFWERALRDPYLSAWMERRS